MKSLVIPGIVLGFVYVLLALAANIAVVGFSGAALLGTGAGLVLRSLAEELAKLVMVSAFRGRRVLVWAVAASVGGLLEWLAALARVETFTALTLINVPLWVANFSIHISAFAIWVIAWRSGRKWLGAALLATVFFHSMSNVLGSDGFQIGKIASSILFLINATVFAVLAWRVSKMTGVLAPGTIKP